jgi:hypothetical protein
MSAHDVTTASELSDYLREAMHAYDEEWDRGEDVPEPPTVQSYADLQMMTRDVGLVFSFPNGAEFQLTIVRTAEADEPAVDVQLSPAVKAASDELIEHCREAAREADERVRAMTDERALRASGVIKGDGS